jgi:hypothetical protein
MRAPTAEERRQTHASAEIKEEPEALIISVQAVM